MPRKTCNTNVTSERLSRRRFLNWAAAGGAALAAPAIVRGRDLNDKLNLAIIGAGGRGADNLRGVQSENVAILCDVSEANLNLAAQTYPNARKIVHFRKAYDHAGDFHAVGISRTEHPHDVAALPDF